MSDIPITEAQACIEINEPAIPVSKQQTASSRNSNNTIVFCNYKGGVAKTSTTLMAAQVFIREFGLKRVLVIDCDTQGNSSEALIRKEIEDVVDLTTLDVCLSDKAFSPALCIYKSWFPGIDFMPSSIKLEDPFPIKPQNKDAADDEISLDEIPLAYRVRVDAIKNIIHKLDTAYDAILIDTAPNLGPLTQAAILAGSVIVIPCSPIKHALYGIPKMLRVVHKLHPKKKPLLIITIFDSRVKSENKNRQSLYVMSGHNDNFCIVGDIAKNSRLADNIEHRRYILSRVDTKKKDQIVTMCENLLLSIGIESSSISDLSTSNKS